MNKPELMKIWKLLDGASDALERLSHDDQGQELLKKHESRIDFQALNGLKNDIEDLIEKKARKQVDLK